mgnify:CR=1 FL=1
MSHSMTTEQEEAQQAYREAARDFAQAELAPHAARWDAEGIFPREAIAKAGELGFCGLYMDPEVGGSGLSRLDAAVVIEELANVDPSTAAYISIHNMASWMVSTWGQQALRAAFPTVPLVELEPPMPTASAPLLPAISTAGQAFVGYLPAACCGWKAALCSATANALAG